jgi:lipoate-protein ligase A
MLFLDLTLDSPQENLALDEALLLDADEQDGTGEVVRIWESPATFVVLGSSSRYEVEANVANCLRDGMPILRRASGGAAIVTGRGCLMYAVLIDFDRSPHLRLIDQAHRHVLGVLAEALSKRVAGVEHVGTSDLAIAGRKFSGNSMRCKRGHALYHGTLLYDFPLACIAEYLGTPPRQPDYRRSRSHESFVTNLSVAREELVAAVREAFAAHELLAAWPSDRTRQLVLEKYGRDEWTRRL